jgi:hypothetical protein
MLLYIYIYIERERERESGSSHFISTGVVHHTCGDEEGKYISFKLQIKDFHSDGKENTSALNYHHTSFPQV